MCCEGVGEGKSWREAPLETLRATAWALDIGGGGASRLEAGVREPILAPTPAPAPTPTLVSAPPGVLLTEKQPFSARPPDPELAKKAEKADEYIRGVVDALREKSKGGEAARPIVEYGYRVGERPTTEEELDRPERCARSSRT